MMLDKIVQRYYKQKQKQKEIEQELTELRNEIISYCAEQDVNELEIGSHKVKIVIQERKEYDDNKLYEALPDPDIWRMLSKPDSSKIASLIKLNVITEEKIKDTFATKSVKLLQVDKK
ncbi:hypothetical protein [Paenibacillus prosopidis]|uniref:Uncharacterized protein n=1 Tax=Paenibacillus prosopidis TaxID=630520 RepID=A0A368VPS5_9BACL|nr:hypothetical protein [Paenibacillus prosopidis]RCW42497.1 hypothetical protein DFP97_11659 [Paenibacillus prosopidis]